MPSSLTNKVVIGDLEVDVLAREVGVVDTMVLDALLVGESE